MSVVSRIRKQGGAAVVTIPPAMLKQMNVDIGQELWLSVAEGKLIAQPAKRKKRYRLSELLAGAEHVADLNAATAWAREGDPVGRELI